MPNPPIQLPSIRKPMLTLAVSAGLSVFSCLSSGLIGNCEAQNFAPNVGEGAQPVGAAGSGQEGPPGVSVPDSPGARELIDKARDKELQKQWKTAAEFYQEALDKYAARVVPVLVDADKGIHQYSGIAPIVQERVSKWPAEGLTIYRNLYASKAADLLAAAPRGDSAALRTIFNTYFATEAGKTAGIRLMDGYLDAGDFQTASFIGQRLLNFHPSLLTDRSMVLYRTAIACHWAGDEVHAKSLLDELKQKSPNDIGSIGGKDVQLVDALTSALSAPAPIATTRFADADTYPAYGGPGGRGDITSSSAKPGASLNHIDLTEPSAAGMMNAQQTNFKATDQLALDNRLAMGIMPVVDNGALFFQDGRCVYAVDADSGSPLPGWLDSYGGERKGRYKMNVFGRARSELLTIAVNPSAVVAVMGQPDRGSGLMPNFGMQAQTPSSVKLVCLNREDGREQWTRQPTDLPESAAALKNAEYGGTPLIVAAQQAGKEDSVLVVAHGSKDNQFDDCYIVCLSLKTGQYRWSTYVGSATRSVDNYGMLTQNPSVMSLANGRVFIMTNMGIIASVDPADGRVIWLTSYNREGADQDQAMMFARPRFVNGAVANNTGGEKKVWSHNPILVSDGHVFALPSDSSQLFVLDASTGEQQKKLPMNAWDSSNVPTTLLGVRDGAVCVTGDKGVFVIDWKKYDVGDQKLATRWFDADVTHNEEHSDICGRGFITSDSIFIPTKNRLIQKTWKSGKTVSFYPARGTFTGDQGPGNMLVTAHNVVVAGQTRVDVYTDLSLVRQKYELAMSASPADPQPRLHYAEALFAGGQIDEAIARIDEAINLIGGSQAMHSGKDRAMIFNTLLEFGRRGAKTLASEKPDDTGKQVQQIDQFYDRAAAAADSPLDQATYRLARAAFSHQQKNFVREIALCQEVLTDPAMRNASLSDDRNAGNSAEAAIETVISTDAAAYKSVEDNAAAALTTAVATHQADELLNVAVVYPNSKAAVDARMGAVHLYEADNQPDKAISVLRRMYASATDGGTKAHYLESIVNDFLATPNGLGPAIDRLCRAARITPDQKVSQPIRLADGSTLTNITYQQAIAKLRQMQADADAAALPDFHLATPVRGLRSPFVKGVPPVIGNVTSVVHPLRDFSRPDQILTWSVGGPNAGLSIFASGETTPTKTLAEVNQQPLGAAAVGGNWLVWSASAVYQINADGKLGWTYPVDHLSTLQVSGGGDAIIDDTGLPTQDDNANNVRLMNVNGQLIRVQGGGVILNRRGMVRFNGGAGAAGGLVVPPPPVILKNADETITAMVPSGPGGEQILVATSTGRVMALSARNGQLVWQNRLVDRSVDQLLANGHFTVLRMDDGGGALVAVFETPTGKLVGKRRFGPENLPNQLVNVALSEEATLALTLATKVVVKDLYDPWKVPPAELKAQTNRDNATFIGLSQPDQLIVKGGRLACLYDAGRYLRGYDLSINADPTNPLQTEAATAAVSLRMIGSRVFIATSSRIVQHNLADPTDFYKGDPDIVGFPPRAMGLWVGKDYAVMLYDPVDRGPAGSPQVRLVCYRRALIKDTTREGGNADYVSTVASSAGITDWLACQGGVYYLTKDGNLHLLRGARM